jgi:hypothetical protein
MGWRAQNAYDDEAQQRWRALPWRELYPLRLVVRLAVLSALLGLVLWSQLLR